MIEGDPSHILDEASCSSAQSSLQGATDTSGGGGHAELRMALARLQLDTPQTEGLIPPDTLRQRYGCGTSWPRSPQQIEQIEQGRK
ncbi:unnamed protein product [Boreogadus saida]